MCGGDFERSKQGIALLGGVEEGEENTELGSALFGKPAHFAHTGGVNC